MTKKVGNTALLPLQKVDYNYNIRGWLTEINKVDGTINPLTQGSDPQDLFAFKINYNTVENESNYVGKELYNGNISETYWRTSNDNVIRKYGYKYDDLNRLKEAIYQKPDLAAATTNSYNESVTYDKNGNIMTLQRKGEYEDSVYNLLIDNLTYSYENSNASNRLAKVTDTTNVTAGFKDDSNGTNDTVDDYLYDSNGNMVKDDNKAIVSITYNHLNLPVEIIFTGTNRKINYLYNAVGQKLEKKVTEASAVTVTTYLDGFQYLNSVLNFFRTSEGYVQNTVSSGQNNYNYVYNYTDHLGNIRLSYTKNPSTGVLTILEENQYYPFGMKQNGYNVTRKQYSNPVTVEPCVGCLTATKYRFNGKELQDELGLNMYDYGARNYDPALGRWMNMDPLAQTMPYANSYNYCLNNPINLVDPTGMSPDGWGRCGNQWEYNEVITKDNYKDLGYSDYSDGTTNNVYDAVGNKTVTLHPNNKWTTTDKTVAKVGEVTNDIVNDKVMNTAISTTGIIGSTASSIVENRFKYFPESAKLFDKPITVRTWLGPGIETSSFKLEKLATFGKVVNGIGYGLFAADIALSGQVKSSHAFYGTVMGASAFCPAIGVSIFAADLLLMGGSYLFTGKATSIGDLIDSNTNGGVLIDAKDIGIDYNGIEGYRKK